jgi:hypothetical protein
LFLNQRKAHRYFKFCQRPINHSMVWQSRVHEGETNNKTRIGFDRGQISKKSERQKIRKCRFDFERFG